MGDSFYFFDGIAKPIDVVAAPTDLKSGKVRGESTPIQIAPANASIFVNPKNVELVQNAVPAGTKPKPIFQSTSTADLPEQWVNYQPADRNPYRLATPPGNQQLCGCCFAFALADTLSDVFVFGRSLPFNPSISPLALLTCFPNAANRGCDGGDLLTMLGLMAKQGVTTTQCLNYDAFCQNNGKCTGDDSHTNTPLPPCGCCSNCTPSKYFTYFVDASSIVIHSLTEISLGSQMIPANPYAVADVKKHLLLYGAALSSIIVYQNFVGGNFQSTRNIYFESESYAVPSQQNPREIVGGHALSIVGWGVEKAPIVIRSSQGQPVTLTNTPYWVVRNSWSTAWGMGGYFRIAMYQAPSSANGNTAINPTTALEMSHVINLPGNQQLQTLGIVVFRPGGFGTFDGTLTACTTSTCDPPNPMTVPTVSVSSTSPPTTPKVSIDSPPTLPPTSPPTLPPTSPATSPPTFPPTFPPTQVPVNELIKPKEERQEFWIVAGLISAYIVVAVLIMYVGQ